MAASRQEGGLLTDAEFRTAARRALDELPAEIAGTIKNVAVVVEDRSPEPGLMGLYHGVPLTRRSHFHDAAPDRITLYRSEIEAICATPAEAREQVRKTVLHEVGHYFGMSESRLRELGFG